LDRSNLLGRFPDKAIPHVGGDLSRGDRVDADVLFGEFEREGFGQAFEPMRLHKLVVARVLGLLR
jgi:hypothetical protein